MNGDLPSRRALLGRGGPEGTQVHLQAGLVSAPLAGLTPLTSAPLRWVWFTYFSVAVGVVTLAMVGLALANVPLPMADGIKECITLFPAFAWAVVFGARMALWK